MQTERQLTNMNKLGVNEIRERYLSFFESKEHLRLPSFSLVPQGDASLLLINSGMAPMKQWFQNPESAPRRRVTTCQKCIRTGDIDNVGKTARHGTFFEMLGNFSFGNYFKHEATAWAWEFFTKVLEIPEELLWISVYEEDDEAKNIWINEVGVDPAHIVKLGKDDNFWEHGTGPCGPCSEIYFDRGKEYGCDSPTCGVGCDCDRFMEVWNLVFTQFDKDEDGNYNPLPNPNIDTGMGLERLAVVMQGVDNLFEVDTVQDVMKQICRITGLKYKEDEKKDVSLRVITDHIRSTVFMVSDGILPSNEGRGYVLRRLLRRAARHGKLLGIDRQFLYEIADTVINCSKDAYPELDEKKDYIKKIIKKEEERFEATIDNGIVVLNECIEGAKRDGRDSLTGEEAFKLHDTFGFPLDLTLEMAQESGLGVDIDGFNAAMRAQKEAARAAREDGSSWDSAKEFEFESVNGATEFLGYKTLCAKSEILGIVAGGEVSAVISKGESGFIVTAKTSFYAEMGGQAGDIGVICKEGAKAEVIYTTKNSEGVYLHEVKVLEGEFALSDEVELDVDTANRLAIARNHSATHLMHKALKDELGSHVAQAGSLVTADRLRFDFSHFEAMTDKQIKAVENKVNETILACLPIEVKELPIDEAKKLGATAQFGEKYGDIVRVVSMGDYSIEFCGGTHLNNAAQCGLFKIVSENGVAAGVRRIEAVTGKGVLNLIEEKDKLINEVSSVLKSNPAMLAQRAKSVVDEMHEYKREIDSMKSKMAQNAAGDIGKDAVEVDGVLVVARLLADGMDMNTLREVGDSIKQKTENALIVLASKADAKVNIIAMATKNAVENGAHAGKVLSEVAKLMGGGGGGKPESAQAGGKDPSKAEEAIAKTVEIFKNLKK